MLEVFNEDCNIKLLQYPDDHFDLAIVDPPYGIGFSDYQRGSMGDKVKERFTKTGKKQWDAEIPTEQYFKELMRVSKNQIIWGGNYFPLPPTQCFIFWYKQNPVPNFADGELAWTSFKKPAKCFDYRYFGNLDGKSTASDKIHPTQKPVALYKYILEHFATPGMKILDTHMGGGSIAIACHYFGVDLTAFEVDTEYYNAALKRIKEATAQLTMF